MSKITLRGRITFSTADITAAKQALPSHIEATLAETGCRIFEVKQATEDGLSFDVYEEFDDEASFRNHQTRSSASAWGAISRQARRNYQIQGLDD